MKKRLYDGFCRISGKLLGSLSGDRDHVEKIFYPLYGGDSKAAAEQYQKELRKKYLLILVLTLCFCLPAFLLSFAGSRYVTELKRPEPGASGVQIPLEITGEYDGKKVKEKRSVSLAERELTPGEIQEAFDQCEAALREMFTTADGTAAVCRSVDLPEQFGEQGITIRWSSSDPVLIAEDGSVDTLSLAGESETVILSAELTLRNTRRTVEIQLLVKRDPEQYGDSMKTEISRIVDSLGKYSSISTVFLPDHLESGMTLHWEKERQSFCPFIVFLGLAGIFCVYAGRYSRAERKVRQYRERVTESFPAVMDKLILLLNSGMTVLGAMTRISEDYEKSRMGQSGELASEAAAIGRRVRNTNASMIEEWKQFARRMESADMLRFCTVLEDHLHTGSELAEKLERESRNMREMRRKDIRKRIHMIDSKMIVPMIVMLFSLMLITVAPAMMSF